MIQRQVAERASFPRTFPKLPADKTNKEIKKREIHRPPLCQGRTSISSATTTTAAAAAADAAGWLLYGANLSVNKT